MSHRIRGPGVVAPEIEVSRIVAPTARPPAPTPGTGRFRSAIGAVIQRARLNPRSLTRAEIAQLHRSIGNAAVGRLLAGTPAPNRTGLPDGLKANVEAMSNLQMDDVRVHYNSPEPAELQAHAFARGREIHLGPGQERHLPHEAWHVVQQAQGRVRPTMQMAGGVAVSDDRGLEREADLMGERALSGRPRPDIAGDLTARPVPHGPTTTVQRVAHAALGTMIHHVPDATGVKPKPIDPDNWREYAASGHLAEDRGIIIDRGSCGTFTWDAEFSALVRKLSSIRHGLGIPKARMSFVINANLRVIPGSARIPADKEDVGEGVFAFGSAWSMVYTHPKGNKRPLGFSETIDEWKKQRDHSVSSKAELDEEKARDLLWTAADQRFRSSKNTAIPYRGLRNAVLESPITHRLLSDLEKGTDYVHIMTLDSDVDVGDGSLFREIEAFAEEKLVPPDAEAGGGYHLTATDYVYDRADLFDWFAGALDKFARLRLEAEGWEPYPAEPGLTISYHVRSAARLKELIRVGAFGPEKGDKREVEVDGESTGRGGNAKTKIVDADFKELTPSEQSVEGKNLRERFKRAAGPENFLINRTRNYLIVAESPKIAPFVAPGENFGKKPRKQNAPQIRKSVKDITKKWEKGTPITAKDVKSLFSSDIYHNLKPSQTPKRDEIAIKDKLVQEAADILNAVRGSDEYDGDTARMKSVLQQKLNIGPGPVDGKEEETAAVGGALGSGPGSSAPVDDATPPVDVSTTVDVSMASSTSTDRVTGKRRHEQFLEEEPGAAGPASTSREDEMEEDDRNREPAAVDAKKMRLSNVGQKQ